MDKEEENMQKNLELAAEIERTREIESRRTEPNSAEWDAVRANAVAQLREVNINREVNDNLKVISEQNKIEVQLAVINLATEKVKKLKASEDKAKIKALPGKPL